MKSQYSSYHSYPNVYMNPSSLVHNQTECIYVHTNIHKFKHYRRTLHDNPIRIDPHYYMNMTKSNSLNKACSARPILSLTAIFKESFTSTFHKVFQFNPRDVQPPLIVQYERFHPPTKPKFSNRESDPPGDPPWSNTLSNNSQTRIVPFTNRLADDPIGKEAEREAKIIRRYQICH